MVWKIKAKFDGWYIRHLPTYKGLVRKRKTLSLVEIGVLLGSVVWVTFLVLSPPKTSDKITALAWATALGFSGTIVVSLHCYLELKKANIERTILFRELWFIKHRLGLPLDPEELEDIEAYKKWLESRKEVRRGRG